MYKLFGIPNCDTVKKARLFLESVNIEFEFIDFKKYRPTLEDIDRWTKRFGGPPVNVKGITYKKHKDLFEKLSVKEQNVFIQDNTSMIKRPILQYKNSPLFFGFDQEKYSEIFKK